MAKVAPLFIMLGINACTPLPIVFAAKSDLRLLSFPGNANLSILDSQTIKRCLDGFVGFVGLLNSEKNARLSGFESLVCVIVWPT